MSQYVLLGGAVTLGAGLVTGIAGMGIAAAMGKCGGSIAGLISFGDCRGEYLINISKSVFENIVTSYSVDIKNSQTNNTLITQAQQVNIMNSPPTCKISISQIFDSNIKSDVVISNKIKVDTVKNIIKEVNSDISSKLDDIVKNTSNGKLNNDLVLNIKDSLTKIENNNKVINSIIESANSLIVYSNQMVNINYQKLNSNELLKYYVTGDGCNIDIKSGVLLSLTLDSLFTSTINYYNNYDEFVKSLVQLKDNYETVIKKQITTKSSIKSEIKNISEKYFGYQGIILFIITLILIYFSFVKLK